MNNQQTYYYQSNFVYPPGETLLELLEERGMTQAELARRMGRPKKTINELIKGKTELTSETALQLEKVLQTPAHIWLNLEGSYREYLARTAEITLLKEQSASWLDRFPYQEMMRYGWLIQSNDEVSILRSLLMFFGIASFVQWDELWSNYQVQFRKSSRYESDPYALSAWICQGHKKGRQIVCARYDKEQFRKLLENEIRPLTQREPAYFLPQLQRLCASVGVAVVFIPELKQIRVNGATSWLTSDKALIQLSLRHKTDDQFWFSFFHEAAHILYHGKREVYMDMEEQEEDEKEVEANRFATNMLISESA